MEAVIATSLSSSSDDSSEDQELDINRMYFDIEQQVSIILYGDDIPKYENLFGIFETYLVSCAKVREPCGYSIRVGTYEWVADRYTIIEAVTNNNGSEAPLPAPTKLDTLSFSAIEQQRPSVEFALRLATRYQLTILTNPQYVKATTLTNWVKHNERMLLSYTLRSSSSSSLNLAPIED
ncbi:hypothetical protein FXO38_06669 [Capsicum annuum]|nr:hypothetical protein FXO38_06669 [Capsicum annuum]KAF3673660.1 hypothetical protein FXO37_06851 [Capsicum annuum]